MSFISEFFAGGAEGIFKGVADVVKTFKADPLEVLKLETAIQKAILDTNVALSQAQTRINEIEAASTDKFASRWRPFIGWVCGGAFAYQFILEPFAMFVIGVSGRTIPTLPVLDWSTLSVVLMGMLGLGAMRSYERVQGVK